MTQPNTRSELERHEVTPELVQAFVDYDAETGQLTWKQRDAMWFNKGRRGAEASALRWNKRYAGMPAFTTTNSHGYKHSSIFGFKFKAHRVAWACHHGEWPENEIDHINGDKTDNRLVNLRAVTALENCKNKRRQKNNTSGATGVLAARSGGWVAYIKHNRKSISLGRFDSKQDAIAARKAAEKKFGYHKNYGRDHILTEQDQ